MEVYNVPKDVMSPVYIVICSSEEQGFYIDSVWYNSRKANRRCEQLNSDQSKEWREKNKYDVFKVIGMGMSK